MSRADAQKMEEWARSQNGNLLVDFSSRDGEIERILKDISERVKGNGNFSYSRFFAVGLFRLLELSNATEPTVLDKVVPSIIKLSCHLVCSMYFLFYSILFLHPWRPGASVKLLPCDHEAMGSSHGNNFLQSLPWTLHKWELHAPGFFPIHPIFLPKDLPFSISFSYS
jgi:hypothetical protein